MFPMAEKWFQIFKFGEFHGVRKKIPRDVLQHGRIKVKTTAEQQETKRKEREKKLKLYNAATGKIFNKDEIMVNISLEDVLHTTLGILFFKRKNKEFDEDLLTLTGEVLSQNSDLYTLWNIRKETFLHMKEIKTKEEMEKICNDELHFLESCLKGNPKSYGTWHHRCFVLDNMANPDWKRELQLCNLFLEYDERNFHCWDYRRLVVKRSKVPIEEELEFTTNKIHNNFSNFSSWHYRSKLLPLVYPDPTNPVGVKEEILLKEFEAVQNAFFTDPDDQSAWFYHRWLLGRGRKKMVLSCLYASIPQNRVIVTTSQPILVGSNHQIEVYLKDVSIEGSWSNVAGNSSPYSRLWIFSPKEAEQLFSDSDQDVSILVKLSGSECESTMTVEMPAGEMEGWTFLAEEPGSKFSHELSAATSSTLERELESIRELHDVEPNNKWTLLTLISLMKALDPLKYMQEINRYTENLQQIDPKRRLYYKDFRSRCVIENYLEDYDYNCRIVSLNNLSLTTLYHPELLVLTVTMNLSGNSLVSATNLHWLQCLTTLNLDNNQISSTAGLGSLSQLKDLSLRNNLIEKAEDLEELSQCPSLTVLNIKGNPICNNAHVQSIVFSTIVRLESLDGTVRI